MCYSVFPFFPGTLLTNPPTTTVGMESGYQLRVEIQSLLMFGIEQPTQCQNINVYMGMILNMVLIIIGYAIVCSFTFLFYFVLHPKSPALCRIVIVYKKRYNKTPNFNIIIFPCDVSLRYFCATFYQTYHVTKNIDGTMPFDIIHLWQFCFRRNKKNVN